jgi:hypothetical protein
MRKTEANGVNYMGPLADAVDHNQHEIVDDLITPHSTQLNEILGPQHRITSKVPAYNEQAQPVQARGRICWNKAYNFQQKGPSYLDGSDR